jgi:hypothetical protein
VEEVRRELFFEATDGQLRSDITGRTAGEWYTEYEVTSPLLESPSLDHSMNSRRRGRLGAKQIMDIRYARE